MSEQPFNDGPDVTGPDPGDALIPGYPTDVEHQPDVIDAFHPDYVEAAPVPEVDTEAGAQ